MGIENGAPYRSSSRYGVRISFGHRRHNAMSHPRNCIARLVNIYIYTLCIYISFESHDLFSLRPDVAWMDIGGHARHHFQANKGPTAPRQLRAFSLPPTTQRLLAMSHPTHSRMIENELELNMLGQCSLCFLNFPGRWRCPLGATHGSPRTQPPPWPTPNRLVVAH